MFKDGFEDKNLGGTRGEDTSINVQPAVTWKHASHVEGPDVKTDEDWAKITPSEGTE